MAKKSLLDNILKRKGKSKHAAGADKVLLRAHKRAERIIEKAAEEADLLVSEAEILSDELRGELEDTFRENIRTWTARYEKALREKIEKSMESYGELLETELQSGQKVLRQRIGAELVKAKAEIGQYKESRMKEVDRTVAEVVKKVSWEVLNRSIPAETYEAMVIQALEKAKREGVF